MKVMEERDLEIQNEDRAHFGAYAWDKPGVRPRPKMKYILIPICDTFLSMHSSPFLDITSYDEIT